MAQKQFSLAFHIDTEEQYEQQAKNLPKYGFSKIAECFEWCSTNKVATYHVYVTEYDIDTLDGYGLPEIMSNATLEEYA